MKNIAIYLSIILFASCNNDHTGSQDIGMNKEVKDISKSDIVYPYPIEYSSQFEISDPENGKMVLDLWTYYDNNTLDKVREHFADTVSVSVPGLKMRSVRDSVLSVFQVGRNTYKSVKSTVDVVLSVRAIDKNQNWVLVWGDEIHTDQKNVTDTVAIHEAWLINNQGKVAYMEQFVRHK